MTERDIWRDYTSEVLAWQLGEALPEAYPAGTALAAAQGAGIEALAARLLRMAAASGRPMLALMGLGDGALAARLLEVLPAAVTLRVLEPSPHRARAVLGYLPHLASCLLVDTSPWALLLLALEAGLTPDNCTLGRAHPESPPSAQANTADDGLRVLQHWRRLFFGATREELPPRLPCHGAYFRGGHPAPRRTAPSGIF